MAHFDWRATFFFIAPFCFIGSVTATFILKKDEIDENTVRRMDWPGAALSAMFICALAVAINFSADWGLTSLRFIGVLAVSVVALILFIRRESRVEAPLMKLDLFKNPVFSFSNGASICSWIMQQMTTFLVPFFLINIMLVAKDDSGLIMLATPLAMMIFSPVGGGLADRYGSRRPALIGLCTIAAGCLLLSSLNTTTPVQIVVIALLMYGVGNGFCMTAINASIFSAVPREHSGLASGMVATMRNLGQGLGVAFGGAIMAIRQAHYYRVLDSGAGIVDGNQVYLSAQRDAYYFGIAVVAIAIFCMSRIPAKSRDG
jgi:MFS family permease